MNSIPDHVILAEVNDLNPIILRTLLFIKGILFDDVINPNYS